LIVAQVGCLSTPWMVKNFTSSIEDTPPHSSGGAPLNQKYYTTHPTVLTTPDGLGCDATLLINGLTEFLFCPRVVGSIDAFEFL